MISTIFDNKIILIGNEENEGLKYLSENRSKMKDIYIYSIDKARQLVLSGMFKCGMPEEGMIFIKHPFLPVYLPNDSQLELNICRCSINHYLDFISRLGAIKWKFTVIIEEHSFLKRIFSGKLKTIQGNGSLHVESTTENKFKQELNLEEFNYSQSDRSILTLEEYEEACNFYDKSYYLKSCPECQRILDFRAPNRDKQKGEFHLKLQISTRMNEVLKIAADLDTLHGVDINTNYTSNNDLRRTIFMDSSVSFLK
ncbi:hypothetical protein [Bacteroides sp. GM023]|uniref:hypothetical protein n=1 Tax=Bacteroides sp. GM023 TaxID=2723058 RepID=UPI00168AB7DB|nr:hypothetical protein [Bacteroides sp. GM023]MBD3592311.1 hypothetical protein [Bacteroides sp. GM023]